MHGGRLLSSHEPNHQVAQQVRATDLPDIGLLGKGVIAIEKTQGSVDEWRTPLGKNLKAALLVPCAVSPGLPSLVTWR